MNTNEIKPLILKAIDRFIKKDKKALMSVNIYEPTLSHRIALYLENLFPRYNVDCEYSKNLYDQKRNSAGDVIRPDIIIHRRITGENLVMIEVKKNGINSNPGKKDIKKLIDGVHSDGLNYSLGVFIGILKKRIEICWINKNVKEETIIKYPKIKIQAKLKTTPKKSKSLHTKTPKHH